MNTHSHPLHVSRLTLAVALALSATAVSAAEPPAGIEQIIIEGQRHTSSSHLQSINESDVRTLSAATSDTASLLSMLAGVSVNQTGAVSSLPMIRGLSDDRLRIKVDGMDMIAACPNHMNPPLSYMAPSDVGQMTVFAGITPVSVGGDSIGGTVISESRTPEFSDVATFEGEAGGFSRSNIRCDTRCRRCDCVISSGLSRILGGCSTSRRRVCTARSRISSRNISSSLHISGINAGVISTHDLTRLKVGVRVA
jgi:outer membrane receptor protein involved in Fe transport